MAFQRTTNDLPINLLLIALCVIAVVSIIIWIYLFRKAEKFELPSQQQFTYTGIGMACSELVKCQEGFSCQNTVIGNVCVAEIGTTCTELRECINTATICNGRCINQTGGLGDLCSNTAPCSNPYVCELDPYSYSRRCLIPQGSGGCQSFYDCVPGSSCENNVCVAGKGPLDPCDNSLECGGSQSCIDGFCQPGDILTTGSVGSYCTLGSAITGCRFPFVCTESQLYNLPTGIGYCTNQIALLGEECTRFVGCLDVGVCSLSGTCTTPNPINICVNSNQCSGGFVCMNGTCIADKSIVCKEDSNCISGTCGGNNYSYNKMTVQTIGSVYNWGNLGFSDKFFDTISIREVVDQGIIRRNILSFYIARSGFQIDGIPYNVSFKYPSDLGIIGISTIQIKLNQNYRISYFVSVITDSGVYRKLIIRSTINLIPLIVNIINLSEAEASPYPGITGTITTYSYDYLANFVYLIEDSQYVYAHDLTDLVPVKIGEYPDGDIRFVTHYRVAYNIPYYPKQLVLGGYKLLSGVSDNDYYLVSLEEFTIPLAINLGPDINGLALTFSVTNNIEDFQFFFTNAIGYFHGVYNSNSYKVEQVSGYIPNLRSNLVQSLSEPQTFLVLGTSCH